MFSFFRGIRRLVAMLLITVVVLDCFFALVLWAADDGLRPSVQRTAAQIARK
jgi:hypothetical protein